MSDSLSSADRDARIAEIERFDSIVCGGGGGYASDIIAKQSKNIAFLIEELRAVLPREAEANTVILRMYLAIEPVLGDATGTYRLQKPLVDAMQKYLNRISSARSVSLSENG